jgi:hypothetical protein
VGEGAGCIVCMMGIIGGVDLSFNLSSSSCLVGPLVIYVLHFVL